ncbi:hypothetical protein CHU_3437 [Sporocytophaga myxococcoides]|uniref:Secretion system C-terminal sorting domain-containing protein n=1 Tax=Sporocytophaga myxococcoides TaxID=153721 RepID=A0A098LEQ6_9BACT|nr:T9SS type A sorting domain-containing protein [Sporocytophaga myxococcoides]GAL85405.1 hypothetical protein CHU_3437 [Sporocytophaga myxococcoides]
MFLILLLLSIYTNNTYGQIVVAGTDFNPSSGNAGRTYIGLDDIVQYGIQTGSLTSTPPLAPNVNTNIFNATYYYAITDSPFKLDTIRYKKNTPADYMFVYSPKPAGGNVNVLEYSVKGLVPSSAVSVTVNYCSVTSSTYAPCASDRDEFKGGINLDQNNQLNGTDSPQLMMGACSSVTYTGTATNSGDMIFRLNATRNGSCQATGISKIEVKGFIQPTIISSQGNEVCAGEQISLQAKTDYNASYKWQVNSGSGWTDIPGGTNKSQLYEVTNVKEYKFRLILTPSGGGPPITSNEITVNAITCCQENGVAASRQTIYYDDFGRIDLSDKTGKTYKVWDYTDPLNPVEVTKTTTTPFRWPIAPAPLNATFKGTGTPLDGEYAVAGYLTGYNAHNGYDGAKLEWANRVTGPTTPPDLSYDHSGTVEGAALFLNCPINTGGKTLYERTISNLCFGKQLFFECWIAVFTNSAAGAYNPVDVKVRLTDGGNAANVVETSATATRQADGGGVWVRIGAQINLSGNSLKMEIINNQNVSENGNDLVLDDIKIMACAPPAIDLFFDLATLSKSKTICGTDKLDLFTKTTALLKAYYNNNPYFLYQWTRTPNDVTSWKNLGAPGTPESHTIANALAHAAFTGLPDGDKVYFRVIAATQLIFNDKNNFQGVGNYANINDPCKNYSVSPAIEAYELCPLPIELLSFAAASDGDRNKLMWTTSWEKNNAYFIIERSDDGKTFSQIGRVEGNGTINNVVSYSFFDQAPLSGTNYYRLKQVDYNGAYSFSKVVSLNHFTPEVAVYPNPNNGACTIKILTPAEEYNLEITDIQGKSVYNAAGNEIPERIEISNLTPGFYLVRINLDGQTVTKKLIVY